VPILRSPLKKRWLVLFCLISLLLLSAVEPTDVESVTGLMRHAQLATLSSAGRTGSPISPTNDQPSSRDAEAIVRRVAERRPLDPQPWRKLGDLYLIWGRPDDALYAYGQAIYRGDDSTALARGLAQLYTLLDDRGKAVQHWNDYLVHHPDDREARFALVWTLMDLGNWVQTRSELQRLLDADPNDTIARAWLGLLLINSDKVTGRSHLRRAVKDPDMATVLKPVVAAESISSAVDDPAYRAALLGVSFLDLDVVPLGEPSAWDTERLDQIHEEARKRATNSLALRSFMTAISHNPGYADAYAYLGQTADQLGQSAWAQASLGYAFELAPGSPVVQTLLGLYWDRHGKPALARRYYKMVYNQDQTNIALPLEIAATYLAEKQYTAAEAWLLSARETAPNNPQVWEALTHYYVDQGIDVERSGLSAAERFLELAPDEARAYDLMGWALFLTGEYDAAKEHLTQALTLKPTLASAHFHLGRLNAQQGHYAEAAQEYRQAAANDKGQGLAAALKRAREELPHAYQDEP
jgi:tetratricopeptide (TPR) repeat protein